MEPFTEWVNSLSDERQYLWMHGCVCIHWYAHVSQRTTTGIKNATHFLWNRVLISLEHLIRLGWLTFELQSFSCLCHTNAGLQVWTATPRMFTWVLEEPNSVSHACEASSRSISEVQFRKSLEIRTFLRMDQKAEEHYCTIRDGC